MALITMINDKELNSLERKSSELRLDILNAIKIAKKGHIGGSYSIVDILVTLFYG